MLKTTVGQLLINEALPPDIRDHGRVLDKKGAAELFQLIAEKYPQHYRDVAKRLMDVGRDAAFTTGGMSFGLNHIAKSPAGKAIIDKIRQETNRIALDPKLSDKTDAKIGLSEREAKLVDLASKHSDALTKAVLDESLREANPLAHQVKGAGRGNPTNLRSIRGADLLYVDQNERVIPTPILRSYSEGLSPVEYYAGSFGARKGVIDTKFATQEAGDLSKQFNQATHRLIVTHHDVDHDGSVKGLPVDSLDPDNVGALLAADTGPFKRNEHLTHDKLQKLHDMGHEQILVRSPMVGGAPDGGLLSRDVGFRERGMLAPVGDFVGIAASQAATELLSQAQLCIAEDTPVSMADGSSKNIQDIKPGEEVIGCDIDGVLFPVKVLNVFNNGSKECVKTTFMTDGKKRQLTVTSTADHKIYCTVKRKKKGHFELEKGLFPIGAKATGMYIEMPGSLERYNRKTQAKVGYRPTYDLEVAHPDHMFLLANGLVVSNSSKHLSGVASAAANQAGFNYINQLVQVPKHFPGGATHAHVDGKIQDIKEAPAGGWYVNINDEQHYVRPERNLKVKKGDTVEAGDTISDGIPNPAELVRHKHIGEGRRLFMKQFREAYNNSNMAVHRRNVEVIARGLIDHVRLNQEIGDYIPGDIVPYHMVESAYIPRSGFQTIAPKKAIGKYLEKPALHYTVGTKIQPSMASELEKFKVPNVLVHDDPPPFEPEMVRARANISQDPDWFAKMLGSDLKKNLLTSTWRGRKSDEAGTSFVPGLARAVDFGRQGPVKDWHTSTLFD